MTKKILPSQRLCWKRSHVRARMRSLGYLGFQLRLSQGIYVSTDGGGI
ncbi:hypothetical protein [Microcoleus sp. bin38.metabat.b11b12b14.051]|nr:hypothetical protein [Microcoleus sp. bin38.metabat.b11b12b14.051]